MMMYGLRLRETLRSWVRGGIPAWRRITTWDQGSTPTDPAGFRSSGTIDANGRFSGVMNGTAQHDGYQESVLYVSRDLGSLPGLAGLDWQRYALALRLDIGSSAASLVEPLFFAAALDGDPGAGRAGVGVCIRGGSASATNTGVFGATGPTFASAGEHLNSLVSLMQFTYTGSVWETRVFGRAQLVSGFESPGANFGAGQSPVVASIDDLKICAGFGHGSTDALNNYLAEFALDYAAVPIPYPFA